MNPINLGKQETLRQINLRKDELKEIILTKKEFSTDFKARVLLCVDMSGSMESSFKRGDVQSLIERIIPIAMEFDDDGILEIILFDNKAKYIEGVSIDNIYNFVDDVLMKHCDFQGTNYAPFINMIGNKVMYDYLTPQVPSSRATTPLDEESVPPTLGLRDKIKVFITKDHTVSSMVADFKDLFKGLKKTTNRVQKIVKESQEFGQDTLDVALAQSYKSVVKDKTNNAPVYMIVVTDGDNSDTGATDLAIATASHLPIFFQFCGINNNSFRYLEQLDAMDGRYVDNANFVNLNDIKKYTDKQLYELLLQEFPSWINLAKQKSLI